MKNITDFIKEASEEKVFVVKDAQGNILNVFNTKEEADTEAERWNKEDSANDAKVSQENKKEYVKK